MKIKTKLTLTHASIAIFCALLIAVPTINTEVAVLEKDITEQIDLRLEGVNSRVREFVNITQSLVKSCTDHFSSYSSYNLDDSEDFLVRAVDNNPIYSMVYFTSAQPIPEGGFLFDNIHWRVPTDFNQTTREWFKEAKKSRDPYFGKPYVDEMSGDLVVTTSRGVFSDNKFRGVIGADFTINTLAEFVSDLKISKSGTSFLITADGLFVTNEDKAKILTGNFYDEFGISELKGEVLSNEKTIHIKYGDYYFASRRMPGLTGWTFVTIGPKSEIYAIINKSAGLVTIMLAISLVIAVTVGLFVSHALVKPIKKLGDAVKEIASGNADLTKRLTKDSHDEVGDVVDGFNLFTEKLHQIISRIMSAGKELNSAGSDLSSSTQDTSSSITQIIANIESVHQQITSQSNSVQQTAGAVNEIASNIQSLEHMIENQSRCVSDASSAVEEMIGNIASVNTSVERMAEAFELLEADSANGAQKQEDVNSRIERIEEESLMLQEANAAISAIAEQTNLLAMNAAIEAAHAGEAGKGFSVVADEIRKLSETSSDQSNTIGHQLESIKESIMQMVTASSESRAVFNSLITRISETDQLVRQIKSAMEEQNEGSKQIINALHTMTDSTSEVKTASNEMAVGNQAILTEVQNLQSATGIMQSSMEEMTIGAKKINETGATLSEISHNMERSITAIDSEINEFKV